MALIGRKPETSILKYALKSNRPELIAVYGRRRIGKTFLVRSVYKNNMIFEITGIYNVSLKEQLLNFHLTLSSKHADVKRPSSWIEAFHQLGVFIDNISSKKKKVVFLDEFPWFDSRKSNFLQAFENFWNGYASKRNDLVIVICGSAASYMIKNIIENRGGLHNRLTQKIKLSPFTLFESERLLKSNKINWSRYDILQLYMTIGGVPFYLEKIKSGESVAQTIDRLCFSKNGFLRSEFSIVFASLFEQHDNHEAIIRILASVRKGLTRNQILKKGKIKSGGTLTKTLQELEESGFIDNYLPYKGYKDSLYRICDEYSMFYIKYIEKTKPSNNAIWIKMHGQQSYKIWSGFSFETTCIKHIDQIKEGLKISGINSSHGSWIEKHTKNPVQIDLLIDRDDNVINLCEMKFYNDEFSITKNYASEITKKVNSFTSSTNTKKNIFVTFITSYGLADNKYRKQLVQNELTLDHLFADV